MKAKSTLLSPRWVAGHLLALALVVLFVNMGAWQLRRLDQRREANAVVEAGMRQPPVALLDLLASGGDLPEHRTVTVSGTFDVSEELLLRGRSLDGEAGYGVLTPLVLGDDAGDLAGSALLVVRGWVPYALDQAPVTQALPPAGEVTVTGRVRVPTGKKPGTIGPTDPAEGELVIAYYVDSDRLQPQMPYPLVDAYVELTAVEPPHPEGLPRPLPAPSLDEGPHLLYAVQWFSFALIGVVGYFFLMRNVLRPARRRTS